MPLPKVWCGLYGRGFGDEASAYAPAPCPPSGLCHGSSPRTEKVVGISVNEFACRTACAACRGQAAGLQELALQPCLLEPSAQLVNYPGVSGAQEFCSLPLKSHVVHQRLVLAITR